MKLSFNRTVKRMRGRFEVSEFENGAYFFDYGCVVGKLIENEILQLVVQDENEVKLLVLARNMKRKCGQELTVADMVFVEKFQSGEMLRCLKRRKFVHVASDEVEKYGVRPIGFVQYTDDGMKVRIPKLAVDEEMTGLERFDGRKVFIVNSRTKQIKNA